MGLFTDAYDLFCIPPIMKLLGRIYYKNRPSYEIPAAVISVMVGVPLLGTVVGQIVFGLACCSRWGSSGSCSGWGSGGDYPLSATIMSEFSNRRTRGAFIAAVFSMQGFGILVSSTVTMVVCAIFDRATKASPADDTPEVADLAWRLILMIGRCGGADVLLADDDAGDGKTIYKDRIRWSFIGEEHRRYTALVERNVEQAAKDMQKVLSVSLSQITEQEQEQEQVYSSPSNYNYSLFSKQFLRRHGRDLFSCATTWFLVDIVFYSNNLFQSQIYSRYLPKPHDSNAFQEAFHVAKLQAIIAICSTIPGYYATVYFIDRVGRVKIQIMGFLFMAIGLFSIGIPYKIYWRENTNIGFMILYGLTFFSFNFGPNTTTFIVPAELFPARFRSTCHGISGAAGKIGAIIGSVGFLWASHGEKENGYSKGIGMTASLVMLGGVCIFGMIITYFFTRETMGRSLEENENEDDQINGVCFFRCIADPCTELQSPGNI
ncbi:hypothetical protein DH2020_004246 [Rehmannia glutinosa]|uniref:Major facilitator superfamily (MFS) profile domain-containing protein n=1 Tax=Rehmannia glutinosa TaxID=99300 RepID=A0ABR0XP91_REHGL